MKYLLATAVLFAVLFASDASATKVEAYTGAYCIPYISTCGRDLMPPREWVAQPYSEWVAQQHGVDTDVECVVLYLLQ